MHTCICALDGEAGCLLWGTNWTFRCNPDEFHGFERRSIAQAVSQWSATAEDPVRSRAKPCELCGVQSGNWTGFPPRISAFLVYRYSLLILVLTTLLSEGRAGEPGGHWIKLPLFRILGIIGQKITFNLFMLQRVNLAYGGKYFANWHNLGYLLTLWRLTTTIVVVPHR